MTCELTIVIPVYNEAALIRSALIDLIDQTRAHCTDFEVRVSANGCVDDTEAQVRELMPRFPELKLLASPEANYGRALRQGIESAEGELVICEEIDLCDGDFHRRALALLRQGECDFVVGSKRMAGSADKRPLLRRAATGVISGMLRVGLGFRGTDTHGLKAFVRADTLPVVAACTVERDLFASELVIRAQRAGLRVREIPVTIAEKRPPSVQLMRRVPRVLGDLGRLMHTLGPR